MRKLYLKYKLYIEHDEMGNGITQVSGNIKGYFHYLLPLLWGKISRRKVEIKNYEVKPHFKGWDKKYIGKEVEVLLKGISLPRLNNSKNEK